MCVCTMHRAGVVDLAYSDDYRFLLSAGVDHQVHLCAHSTLLY